MTRQPIIADIVDRESCLHASEVFWPAIISRQRFSQLIGFRDIFGIVNHQKFSAHKRERGRERFWLGARAGYRRKHDFKTGIEIERFEGRLPLAIAAYNGGPHNVRRWIADHGSGMPIDALCEEIPFEQTHRYVRRVLGHYAAYRAEAGLPPATLELDSPALAPDTTAF